MRTSLALFCIELREDSKLKMIIITTMYGVAWHGVVCEDQWSEIFIKILMRKKLLLALQAFDLTNSLVCRLTKNRYSEMKLTAGGVYIVVVVIVSQLF